MNRPLLVVGLAGMILGWGYPWALLLGLWSRPVEPRPLLEAPSILLLVLLGAACTHLLGRRLGTGRPGQWALVALGVLAVLLAVRQAQYPASGGLEWLGLLATSVAIVLGQPGPPALAFALGVYLWWRGVRLGSQAPGLSDVESAFRWGIGLLAAFGLVLGLFTRPSLLGGLEAQALPYAVGFVCAGLLSVALARLDSLGTPRQTLAVNAEWLRVLLASLAGVVIVALGIAQLVSFNALLLLLQPLLAVLGWLVVLGIYLVVIPLAYVVEWLVYLLLQVLRPDPSRQPPEPLSPSNLSDMLSRLFGQELPPEIVATVRAAGAVVLLGLGLLLVTRAARRWRPSQVTPEGVEDERESVWRPGAVRQAVLDWLRRLLARVRARAGTARELGRVEAGPAQVPSGPTSARALYRALLRLGAAAGAPRSGDRTPYEHLPALERALAPPAAVVEITESYVQARYAEQEPAPDALARAQASLATLHRRPDGAAEQAPPAVGPGDRAQP